MKNKNAKRSRTNKVKNEERKRKKAERVKNEKEKREAQRAIDAICEMRKTRGINRTDEGAENIKYTRYVREENIVRRIVPKERTFEHEKTNNTHGRRKEGRKICSTKSQWAWRKEKEKYVRDIIPEREYRGIETRKEDFEIEETIILYDGISMGFFHAQIKMFDENAYETIAWENENDEKNIRCIIKKWKPPYGRGSRKAWEKPTKTPAGILPFREVVGTALRNGIQIYEIMKFVGLEDR